MYLSIEIAKYSFFAGVPLSFVVPFVFAPLGVYCLLNFGVPIALLMGATMTSNAVHNRLMLAENGMAMRYLRNWRTQNFVLFLIIIVCFVILRTIAAVRTAALLQALEQ